MDMHNDNLSLATGDTLGGRISLARDACDISIDDAADMTGVHPDVWQAWENDRDEPFASHLETVAESLDVSLSWLVSGRGSGPSWDPEAEPDPALA